MLTGDNRNHSSVLGQQSSNSVVGERAGDTASQLTGYREQQHRRVRFSEAFPLLALDGDATKKRVSSQNAASSVLATLLTALCRTGLAAYAHCPISAIYVRTGPPVYFHKLRFVSGQVLLRISMM